MSGPSSGPRRPDGAALVIAGLLFLLGLAIFWQTRAMPVAGQYARVGPEGPGLVFGLAALGHHTLQIGDAQIRGRQSGGEGREGITTCRDDTARAIGQHHIAHDGDRHRLVNLQWRRSGIDLPSGQPAPWQSWHKRHAQAGQGTAARTRRHGASPCHAQP